MIDDTYYLQYYCDDRNNYFETLGLSPLFLLFPLYHYYYSAIIERIVIRKILVFV
jgi:hypothetical protein